jgi:hypothetical protein
MLLYPRILIFFDRFSIPELQNISPWHIWNADEIGIMMGIGDNGIVVGDAYRKFLISKHLGNREWVLIIECISAVGDIIPPLVIFAEKNVQQQWFPDITEERFENWCFKTSKSGWTNDKIALNQLKGVFIPHAQPNNFEQWRLLILDDHKSHITVASALAEHRDHSQPSVGNLQGMCVIWWC